jgi:hypothetical protein
VEAGLLDTILFIAGGWAVVVAVFAILFAWRNRADNRQMRK